MAADEVGLYVVDPDEVGVVQGNGIAAPNILRIEIRNPYILDDNVLRTTDNSEAFALDHAFGADTNDGFVRGNNYAQDCSIVIGDGDLGGIRLVILAPVILIDSLLTAGAAAIRVWLATCCSCGSFGADEIEAV